MSKGSVCEGMVRLDAPSRAMLNGSVCFVSDAVKCSSLLSTEKVVGINGNVALNDTAFPVTNTSRLCIPTLRSVPGGVGTKSLILTFSTTGMACVRVVVRCAGWVYVVGWWGL